MSKPYSVTVSIVSVSNGEINQEILLREYATTEEELVMKNFAISDAVIPALDNAMKEMADTFVKAKK